MGDGWAKQGPSRDQVGTKTKEPWQMTRKEWDRYNFDENEHRYLPADYFDGYEFNTPKTGTELVDTLDGKIEIRKDKYGIAYAFDGEKNVGMGDGKAFVVAPSHQKKGIGKALMSATYTGKPIGSRTSAGGSLVGSFHRASVERALADGKPVSPAVLKDYPELTKQVTKEVTTEQKLAELERIGRESQNPRIHSQSPRRNI